VCSGVFQCVAGCCGVCCGVLQLVAVCCSVLQYNKCNSVTDYVPPHKSQIRESSASEFRVEMALLVGCCGVLQCGAVCCGV